MSKRKRQNEEPERKTFHYVDRDVSEPFMIPDSYSQIDPAQMQELQMPEGSLGYTIATGNATGIVVCFEVPPETAMPLSKTAMDSQCPVLWRRTYLIQGLRISAEL